MLNLKNFLLSMLLFLIIVILFLIIVIVVKSVETNNLLGLVLGSFMCGAYTELALKWKNK